MTGDRSPPRAADAQEAEDTSAAPSGRLVTKDAQVPQDAASRDSVAKKYVQEKTVGKVTETWQHLAKEGRFEQAMASVRQSGVDGPLASVSAPDLLLFGSTARFSGEPDLAERAFRKVRQLAPGSPSSALAAYYLSRIAGDVRGDVSASVSWLRVYLKEQGNGDLAATARARLMTLLEARGDVSGAREIARQYLDLHPSGAHVDLARRLTRTPRP